MFFLKAGVAVTLLFAALATLRLALDYTSSGITQDADWIVLAFCLVFAVVFNGIRREL